MDADRDWQRALIADPELNDEFTRLTGDGGPLASAAR
jgi:hypothetical protein